MRAYILTEAETVTECHGDPFVMVDYDDRIAIRQSPENDESVVLNTRQARQIAYRLCLMADELERQAKQ